MKIVDRERILSVQRAAQQSSRLRANDNLHPTLEDPVQRFLNAMEPGTYVRPHRHAEPGHWELFLALEGRAAVLVFGDRGEVLGRVEIGPRGPVRAVEVPPGVWHAVAALEPGTVLFELKPGPYRPLADKDFAPWAPPEGDAGAAELEAWYRTARPGHRWTAETS